MSLAPPGGGEQLCDVGTEDNTTHPLARGGESCCGDPPRIGRCPRRIMMTKVAIASVVLLACALATPASAKGCLKGAVVGGVAGHYAGHHGVIGATVGCLVGRHQAKKRARLQQHQ